MYVYLYVCTYVLTKYKAPNKNFFFLKQEYIKIINSDAIGKILTKN